MPRATEPLASLRHPSHRQQVAGPQLVVVSLSVLDAVALGPFAYVADGDVSDAIGIG